MCLLNYFWEFIKPHFLENLSEVEMHSGLKNLFGCLFTIRNYLFTIWTCCRAGILPAASLHDIIKHTFS